MRLLLLVKSTLSNKFIIAITKQKCHHFIIDVVKLYFHKYIEIRKISFATFLFRKIKFTCLIKIDATLFSQ